MCENGTRVVRFNSAVDIDLSPLPVSKYAFPISTQPFSVRIVLHHITSQLDYQIFNSYKMGNVSEVFDMIEAHKGVNAVDEWGYTLLMLATQKNDLQTVALLLNTRMPKVDVNKAKSVHFSLHSRDFLHRMDTQPFSMPFSNPQLPF
jgi:hypothetical protein